MIRVMHIFFDVDQTLICQEGTLRPGVGELFSRLRADGHHLYVWSGNGMRWEVLDRYNLRHLVAGCFFKPLYNFRDAVERARLPVLPDACVDDSPEVVAAFGGVVVEPYGLPNPLDREMQRVYEALHRYWSE
ncbi:MAG: hypothetical protein HYY02_12170 [Chloroflexi bacterium]|nr:hypothetical protein [Chloroflexota bacterium]